MARSSSLSRSPRSHRAAARPSGLQSRATRCDLLHPRRRSGEARKLTLTGEGNLETEPDMVRITVDLEAQERKDSHDEIDLAAAASTATDLHLKASQGFLASLKELGIPDANITTTALTLSPITNWTNGQSETVGYEARSSLEIEMSASGKLEAAIIKASQDNLAEGVTVNVGAFRPYVSDERMLQLEQDLFDKAMADVTRKAEMFARGAADPGTRHEDVG